jgi:DNA-binding response OmpR family regulator
MKKEETVILVVDDDKEIREGIKIYLTQDDYQVIEAKDGVDALEIVKTKKIHLIIMDVMMPNLDGISATQKIRETSNVPILMLSAKNEDIDKISGLHVGADDYLTKPFSPMELIARVKSI